MEVLWNIENRQKNLFLSCFVEYSLRMKYFNVLCEVGDK